MSRTQKLLVLAVVLAVTVLACSTATNNNAGINPDNNAGNNNDNNVQDEDQPNPVLFQDDFSRTTSGWDREEYEYATTDYGDDVYRIEIMSEEYSAWATPYKSFTNVIIEVETYKASGGDDNGFGIICRHEDVENFYYLAISSDGFAWIGKYYLGEVEALEVIESNDINQGKSTNSLRAECVDDRLTLFVNGELQIELYDSDISSGDVGVIAETFSSTTTEILFDNFIVTRP